MRWARVLDAWSAQVGDLWFRVRKHGEHGVTVRAGVGLGGPYPSSGSLMGRFRNVVHAQRFAREFAAGAGDSAARVNRHRLAVEDDTAKALRECRPARYGDEVGEHYAQRVKNVRKVSHAKEPKGR